MKNIIKAKVIILAAVLLVVGSCTDNFETMNTNPNAATKVPGSNVLGSSMLTSMYTLFGTRLNCYYTGAYSGFISAPDYEYRVDINNSMWRGMYNSMINAHDAMTIAETEENDNLYAAALTFKVYNAHKTTDMWGDIPYSEAFQLEEGMLYPKYDTQETIYKTLLAELKIAADMFDVNGSDIGEGDFMLNGDVEMWKMFCNSLRLRIAVRMSSANEASAKEVIQDVLSNSAKYPIMTENSHNAYWYFPGIAPDEEIWYESMGTVPGAEKHSGWRMQQPIIDALQDNNDPRLSVYADENDFGEYSGHRFGPNDRSDTLNTNPYKSHIADWWMNDPKGFVPYMNCAEVYFCLAEAFERNLVSGEAQEAYEMGITKSCEESGQVSADQIASFLTEAEVAWGSGTTSNLEKVALQKWVCLFKQSVEGWSEARRTDVPLLTGVAEDYAASHNRPPFRMAYADEEKSLNTNFPFDVVEEDIFYGTQMWWDKRTGVK